MSPSDIPKATTDELQARFVFLAERLAGITAERKLIAAEMSDRERTVRLQQRVDAMPLSERQTLRRILR